MSISAHLHHEPLGFLTANRSAAISELSGARELPPCLSVPTGAILFPALGVTFAMGEPLIPRCSDLKGSRGDAWSNGRPLSGKKKSERRTGSMVSVARLSALVRLSIQEQGESESAGQEAFHNSLPPDSMRPTEDISHKTIKQAAIRRRLLPLVNDNDNLCSVLFFLF
jgi:hypothetical protein